MKAVIISYRRGRHTQRNNQMIILPEKQDSKLVGRTVVFRTKNGEIKGRVSGLHGRNGALRVLFEKGMPGQSIGRKVEIIEK